MLGVVLTPDRLLLCDPLELQQKTANQPSAHCRDELTVFFSLLLCLTSLHKFCSASSAVLHGMLLNFEEKSCVFCRCHILHEKVVSSLFADFLVQIFLFY